MNKLTPSEIGRLLAKQRKWTPEARKKQSEIMAEARKHIKRNKINGLEPVDKVVV